MGASQTAALPGVLPLAGTSVLVVDDDSVLCRTVARLLVRAGACVRTATGGNQAIEIASSTVIHLLLTDVDMPDLDGFAVAHAVRMIQPQVEVVFMSGRPREVHSANGGLDEDAVLVEKPFTGPLLVETLVTALRSAVGRPAQDLRARSSERSPTDDR